MLATRSLLALLFLSLLPASLTHADAATIPLPTPPLTETTLFQISRSIQGRSMTESLTCDLATTRALAQLQRRIQREQAAQRIRTDELALISPPITHHRWDADRHHCHVYVHIEIPVLPHLSSTHTTPDLALRFHPQVH